MFLLNFLYVSGNIKVILQGYFFLNFILVDSKFLNRLILMNLCHMAAHIVWVIKLFLLIDLLVSEKNVSLYKLSSFVDALNNLFGDCNQLLNLLQTLRFFVNLITLGQFHQS